MGLRLLYTQSPPYVVIARWYNNYSHKDILLMYAHIFYTIKSKTYRDSSKKLAAYLNQIIVKGGADTACIA